MALLVLLVGAASSWAGELRGVVTDPAGRPVAGAVIAATTAQPERAADGSVRRHVARSDAQGRFVMPDLTAGPYATTATLAGVGSAGPVAFDVSARGAAPGVLLTLKVEASRLDGRLLHAGDPPSAEAMVGAARIRGEQIDVYYAELSEGRFQLNLPAGRYLVKAFAPGWESGVAGPIILTGQPGSVRVVLSDPFGSEPALAAELIEMVAADQALRMRSIEAGAEAGKEVSNEAAFRDEFAAVDGRNQARIAEIIRTKGWPRAARVGQQAADAAWLIVQHGPPALLRANLPAMQAATADGELSWDRLALSIDRNLVQEGKPQRYGSQGQFDANGEFVLDPVESEGESEVKRERDLDARRAQVGLGPIAEYKREIQQLYRKGPASGPKTP